jgi:hypothetical protein
MFQYPTIVSEGFLSILEKPNIVYSNSSSSAVRIQSTAEPSTKCDAEESLMIT